MHILILVSSLWIGSFLYGMHDVELGEFRHRSGSHGEEELATFAIRLHFADNECMVIKEIKEYLRKRIHELKKSQGEGSQEVIDKLEQLKKMANEKHDSLRKQQITMETHQELRKLIDAIVLDAVQKYGEDKDKSIASLEESADRKECHKRWAIGIAAFATIAGTATSLITAFMN